MSPLSSSTWLLEQETRALLDRLAAVKPFVLQETSVAAAALSPGALSGIEEYLATGRREVRRNAHAYLDWLRGPGARSPAAEQQRRFVAVRLGFQTALTHFDLFSEAVTQRSEYDNGVLLSGLDVAAADGLLLPGGFFTSPPVVCSLYAGLGGSIRRARTRLPGGGDNPVALIRIPRERMIAASAVGATLLHELGHEAGARLRLVESVRGQLDDLRPRRHHRAWRLWGQWLSEILPDCWAVSRIGIGSTLGLIALVSLPRRLVFRTPHDDPHPIPWVRVLLSCALGDRLYPGPQWAELADTWQAVYPVSRAGPEVAEVVGELRATLPDLVSVLVEHRPPRLRGWSVGEVLTDPEVHRTALLRRFAAWRADPARIARTRPTVALAVLAQARASGRLTPEREGRLLRGLVTEWAVTSTLRTARIAARPDPELYAGQPIWAGARPAPLLDAV